MLMQDYKSIRNVAVIAHVDHGKTTLVDAMLKQTHLFRDNQDEMRQERIMDSNDLERERGITILAKNCSVYYRDTKINIIDTPGHVDFSGEVERTLSMADGALLIVDAAEGPMPQTRSVLRQALALKLKTIVVINKIDKQNADVEATYKAIESLFLELVSDESQLLFPTLYAEGRKGAVYFKIPESSEVGDVRPLLDTIIEEVRPATGDKEKSTKMLISSIDYNQHVGRISIGKLSQGVLKKGMRLQIVSGKTFDLEHLYVYEGLGRAEVQTVSAGDIVGLTGISQVQIGNTIGIPGELESYPAPKISEPTLHMVMSANSSPFAGREGQFVTSRQIEERLERELESNLSLKVEKMGSGSYRVSGRGELHLSVLLETMRREGYEMEVGKPQAIIKNVDNEKQEPYENVEIVVPQEYEGAVHQECGRRFATLKHVDSLPTGEVRIVYLMPTRVTIGLRSILLTMTRGTIMYSTEYVGYQALGKELPKLRTGVLISSHDGQALAYGLANAQERGMTFIAPSASVYVGMIVGLTNRDEDIRMNVTKGKQLTNMRSKSSDGVIQLAPPIEMSLEQCLDFIEDDELLEITPKSLRLRKKNLSGISNKRMS